MRIIADENNPFVEEAFAHLGEVVALPGAEITPEVCREADVLACRSTIKVNRPLLGGSAVRYVGTATIGTDHLDIPFLEEEGIYYTNAPGCNADSVADYVTAALLFRAQKRGETLTGKTMAVVGCGNVGSRVVRRGKALAMEVLEYDPPLADSTNDDRYIPRERLTEADVVCLHTPLTDSGPYPTKGMVDENFLAALKPGVVLVSAGRGDVVQEKALRKALQSGHIADALLDVWQGEPDPNPKTAAACLIATPHIAGHAFDGKVNGVRIIADRISEALGRPERWDPAPHLPPVPPLELDPTQKTEEEALGEAVLRAYPIEEDDARFREALAQQDGPSRSTAFSRLRKEYPCRRQFSRQTIRLTHPCPDLATRLEGLGFQVIS